MKLSSMIVPACLATSLAAAASADGIRIAVGDLDQRAGAAAFDVRLNEAASKFCFARYRPTDLSAIAACRKAIREEALDQLTPTQRDAFARSMKAGPALASAGR